MRLVRLGLPASKVLRGLLDRLALPAQPVLLVPRELQVLPVLPAQTARVRACACGSVMPQNPLLLR